MSMIFCCVMIALMPLIGLGSHTDQQPGKVKGNLLKAVIKIIATAPDSTHTITGTGFLVSKEIIRGNPTHRAIFLVTNKHMIGDWNIADGDITCYWSALNAYFYREAQINGKSFAGTKIPLIDKGGNLIKNKVYMHPNPLIDIALVVLSDELGPGQHVDLVCFDISYLLDFQYVGAWAGLGDQAFALGYPFGITSLTNNYPLAKGGYLASMPGEEIAVEYRADNRAKAQKMVKLDGKILLFDGLLMPGNSGGPVVIPAEIKVRNDPTTGKTQFTTEETKNLVIGIVSSGLGPSGLTVVYSSTYIREIIEPLVSALEKQMR